MMQADNAHDKPYVILRHGSNIAGRTHYGRRIPSYIEDVSGRKFVFDRLAAEDNGLVPLAQLADDECVIVPGLIYKLEAAQNAE